MRAEADLGTPLTDIWVYLTPDEAREVLQALQFWADQKEGYRGPGWHMHIADGDREFTLAIEP
jgi:hypothetical protein